MTKGFTALAIQSLTTAKRLGVLEALEAQLAPAQKERAFKGVSGMQHKAYRWVAEMEEISRTFSIDGGFEGVGGGTFAEISKVYDFVSKDEELGRVEADGTRAGHWPPEKVITELAKAVDRKKDQVTKPE
jgi:hypothetical protein